MNFCTLHDRAGASSLLCAIVAWAKFCSHMILSIVITVKTNFPSNFEFRWRNLWKGSLDILLSRRQIQLTLSATNLFRIILLMFHIWSCSCGRKGAQEPVSLTVFSGMMMSFSRSTRVCRLWNNPIISGCKSKFIYSSAFEAISRETLYTAYLPN